MSEQFPGASVAVAARSFPLLRTNVCTIIPMHIICLNFPYFVLQLEELAALPAQALSHVHILIHWTISLDNIIFSVDLTPTAKQKPPLPPPVLPGHQELSSSPSMQRNSSARCQVNQLVGSRIERKAKNPHNQAQKLVFKRFSAQTCRFCRQSRSVCCGQNTSSKLELCRSVCLENKQQTI